MIVFAVYLGLTLHKIHPLCSAWKRACISIVWLLAAITQENLDKIMKVFL